MNITDEDIITLYWQRNETAIVETEQKYGAQCLLLAQRILEQMQDAEECVNDTWLHTWNNIPPQRPAFLQAFLMKITRNLAFDYYKHRHAKKRGGNQLPLVLDELSDCVTNSSLPEEQLIQRELQSCIQNFLQTVPAIDRCVFLHRYFLLENATGIAAFYHMKPGTVRANLVRTRKKLSSHLHREGYL